jgi:hypothetical protein
MKNPANRDLFAHWNERRGQRIAPERGDIEPNAIRHVLGDSFFLANDSAANFPFRLAGTRFCALFGRELKNESFFNLWDQADQLTLRKLMAAVVDEKIGFVAHATGRTTDGAPLVVNLELLVLPLLQRGPLDARVLGALAPMTVPFWLGARVVGTLELGMLRHIGPAIDRFSAPRLVTGDQDGQIQPVGQTRGKLVVYEGGRTD